MNGRVVGCEFSLSRMVAAAMEEEGARVWIARGNGRKACGTMGFRAVKDQQRWLATETGYRARNRAKEDSDFVGT